MKIYYLSNTAFCDSQMGPLSHLAKLYDITYGVIIPYTNSNYTKQELVDFCSENNIRFEPFELKNRYRDLRVMASYYKIIKSIRRAQPDVIYFANFDQLYLNLLLPLLNRSKTIIAFHDVESHSNTAFSFLAGMSKKILIKKFKYFQTSSSIQQRILQSWIPGKSVHNISLPLIGFGPANAVPPKPGVTRFLFFGNILYYKGLDFLLKAFKTIAEKYPHAELTIAGRCNNWDEVYAPLVDGTPQIKQQIRFIDNNEIPAIFGQADYVLFPYRDTTQSGPLMISYNYNVPVLVSQAEGFKEFTREGTTGYSFDLYTDNDMERVLEGCIQRSDAEYDALKTSLAKFAQENYSMEAVVKKYGMMFENVKLSAKS